MGYLERLEGLRDTYNSLNVEGLELDNEKLEKLKNDLKDLESEFSKVSIKDKIRHQVSSIQHSLTNLENGLNDTDAIKGDAEAANEILSTHEGVKREIKALSGDIETLIKDAHDEQLRGRNAHVVNMLDKVASIFEKKGLIKEAEALDEISNALEITYKKV